MVGVIWWTAVPPFTTHPDQWPPPFFFKSFCVCVMEQSWYKHPQRSIYLSRQSSAKFVKFMTAFFFLQTIHLSPCHFAGSYAGVWQSLHRWHTGWGRTLPVGCWRQLHQFHPPPSLLPWTCCGHSSHTAVCTVHLTAQQKLGPISHWQGSTHSDSSTHSTQICTMKTWLTFLLKR